MGEPLRVLITGERESGKTTCCFKAVERLQEGGVSVGGVLCPKLYDGKGGILGIEIQDLLSEPPLKMTLARKDQILDGPSTGAYSFSAAGLRFGQEALENGARLADVLFADELGPLEMRGEGFANLLDLALNPSTPPMVIVVRPDLLGEIHERLKPLPVTIMGSHSSCCVNAHDLLAQILESHIAGQVTSG